MNAVFECRTHLKSNVVFVANKNTNKSNIYADTFNNICHICLYLLCIVCVCVRAWVCSISNNFSNKEFFYCAESCVSNYKNTCTITNRLYDIQQGKSYRQWSDIMKILYNCSADVFPDVIKHTENVTSADLLNFARQIATGMVSHVNNLYNNYY